MIIPHQSLDPETLRNVLLEIVTRDGTDHSPVEPRIERALGGLRLGELVLTFDDATKTCGLRRADEMARADRSDPGATISLDADQ